MGKVDKPEANYDASPNNSTNCCEFLATKVWEMLIAASLWCPRRRQPTGSASSCVSQNFEIWTNWDDLFPCLILRDLRTVLEINHPCYGHLCPFLWRASPPSCHVVLGWLLTAPPRPPLYLAQGWGCDLGWAFLGLIAQLGLQAVFLFIVWKEPDCRMKPGTDQKSQETEPWWCLSTSGLKCVFLFVYKW